MGIYSGTSFYSVLEVPKNYIFYDACIMNVTGREDYITIIIIQKTYIAIVD